MERFWSNLSVSVLIFLSRRLYSFFLSHFIRKPFFSLEGFEGDYQVSIVSKLLSEQVPAFSGIGLDVVLPAGDLRPDGIRSRDSRQLLSG